MKAWLCAALLAACNFPKLAAVGDGSTGSGSKDAAKQDGAGSGSGGNVMAGSVAWYHMNDNTMTATSAADATGNGNDAALVHAQVNFDPGGWAGGALHTTGANGYASAPASPKLGVTQLTVEAWVNDSVRPSLHNVLVKGTDFVLGFDSGAHPKLALTLANGSTVSLAAVTPVLMNTWVHIAATWDGTTASIYLNGALDQSVTPASGGPLQVTSSATLDIGPTFPGLIDEARVFENARSAAQILDDATFVAHYALDESGTDAVGHDSSGNVRDLQVTAPMWAAGRAGNALDCDGATTFAMIASDPGLANTGPTSVEAWVNAASQPTPVSAPNVAVLKLQGAAAGAPTSYGLLRCCNVADTNLELHANYQNSSTSADSPQGVVLNNQWHHVAGVFNGANLCFYVDGALVGCSGQITVLGTGAGPFSICASSDGPSAFFTGLVDEVRVYTRELTAAEIRTHYTNP